MHEPVRLYKAPFAAYYGEMYNYANTTETPIDETDVYHAVIIKTTGLVKGWTFKIGTTGPIASFATNSGGAATLVTDVGHGLLTGEVVTIANSTNYNGAHVITRISADTFTIPVAFVAEAGGPNWVRGSSLQANVGSAGIYRITFNCTVSPTGSADLFKIELNKNTTDLDNMAASSKLAVAADYAEMSASGLVSIAEGDYIWLSVKNESAADGITVRHANVAVTKVA